MNTDVRLPGHPDRLGQATGPSTAPIAALVVVVAAALRLWHVAWGLPGVYEEALPVHVALRMMAPGGGIDPNPHFFNYPSLGIELHLAVQMLVLTAGRVLGTWAGPADYRLAFAIDPAPMMLGARALGVAADVLAVLAAIRLGERVSRGAGLLAGALLALFPLAIVTSRSVFVDTLMAALALWALERAVAWRDRGGIGRLAMAAVLAGLAAGCKYPAAVLLLPIAWLAWRREGARGAAIAAGAALLAGAAFLVTTPWVLLDRAAFLRDFSFEGAHAAVGHLGSLGRRAFAFHAANLWRNLGPVALLAAAASPALAWPRRRAPAGPAADGSGALASDVVVAAWLALAGFGLPIAFARIEAERYLLSVLGAAALLAGVAVAGALRGRRTTWVVAGCVALLAWPLAAGVRAAREGAGHTQTEAREFLERTADPRALVVTEGYGPLLPTAARLEAQRDEEVYRQASPRWRARLDTIRPWNAIAIPLGVSGDVTNTVTPAGRAPVTLTVAAHASALNDVLYEAALFPGVSLFVTSSAVRARYEADPARFPRACALYRLLDREARVLARFRPAGATIGPEIVVYEVGDGARAALSAGGALDPEWWTAAMPDDYRKRATALLDPGADPLAPRGVDGTPAAWVRSLRPVYHARVAAFVLDLAEAHATSDRDAEAARIAEANLAVAPEDVPACRIASSSLARLGRLAEARAHLERAFAAGGPLVDTGLALEYARVLRRMGEASRASAILAQLAETLPESDPVGRAARAERSADAGTAEPRRR